MDMQYYCLRSWHGILAYFKQW